VGTYSSLWRYAPLWTTEIALGLWRDSYEAIEPRTGCHVASRMQIDRAVRQTNQSIDFQ